MWKVINHYAPSWSEWFCVFLSAAIPMTVYYLNRQLHKLADPPWKREDQQSK